jgi:hypothetical protein
MPKSFWMRRIHTAFEKGINDSIIEKTYFYCFGNPISLLTSPLKREEHNVLLLLQEGTQHSPSLSGEEHNIPPPLRGCVVIRHSPFDRLRTNG